MTNDRPYITVLDIDGVLADVHHRVHFIDSKPRQWDAFIKAASDDLLIPEGARIVHDAVNAGYLVILVSGRPERIRKITIDWLQRHRIVAAELYMRKSGDNRPAHVIKTETLRLLTKRFNIVQFVDNDPQVIRAVNDVRHSLPIRKVVLFQASTPKIVYYGQEIEGET